MSASRLIFGIVVIGIGVLFLVNSAGIADTGSLLQWWPMIIVLVGVWRLVAGKFRSLFGPLLLIAIGAILQIWNLDAFDLNLGKFFWPAILIVVGIAILAGGARRRNRGRRNSSTSGNVSPIIDVDVSASNYADDDGDATLHAVVGTQDRVISGDFQSASINVVMGSGGLDLRNARIVSKPATLEASVVMGEVKVRVPADWNVRIANSSQMGETKDARPPQSESDSPDLIVRGSVTMGSLQITD